MKESKLVENEELMESMKRELNMELQKIAHVELLDGEILCILKDLSNGSFYFLRKKDEKPIDDLWSDTLFEGVEQYILNLDKERGEILWDWYGSGEVEEKLDGE